MSVMMVQPAETPRRCGVDEAGRGPLAGPVVAAAVVLADGFPRSVLADSKKLSAARREAARALIDREACVGIGWSHADEIDRINIHRATLAAMERALTSLRRTMGDRAAGRLHILVDGRFCPPGAAPCEPIVGGDGRIPEIMAASIVAKTERDRWMSAYGRSDTRYGFEAHKGYPTAAHRAALARHGPCEIHRRSFRGVATG